MRQSDGGSDDRDTRYRAFVANSSEAIWLFSLESPVSTDLPADEQIALFYQFGYLAECNEAMVRLYGFSTVDEAIGTRLETLMPRTDARNVEYLRAFIASGYRLQNGESHEVDRHGTSRILLNNLVGVVAGTELTGAWGMSRDITQLKTTEVALRRSEEHLRLIVESASDYAIISVDTQGLVTLWSPGAEKTFEYPPDEMIGQSFERIFTPEDRAARVPADEMKKALQHGRAEDERWHIRASGQRFWASGMMQPLRDDDGTHRGFIKIARDATERQRFQERLEGTVRERTAELLALNEQLESYSFSVAHDLRAPLRIISTYCAIMQDEYSEKLGEDGAIKLARVTRAAARMDLLITGLLNYNRLLTAQAPTTRVDLNFLVRETLEKYRPLADKAGGRIEPDPSFPTVQGAGVLLAQALDNLVANAIKFVPLGVPPLVRIRSEISGDRVRLYVEDNGIGIPVEHQQRIFEPLKRLHSESEYEGCGLGLSIVKKAMERTGGRVGLISAPGQGSRFWLELPLAPSQLT